MDEKIMMRTIWSLLVALMLLSDGFSAADQIDSAAVRVNRLAGLCRVWGAVKYFHPYLAYKDIDWDSALIQTIPKVNRSSTAADYKSAIEGMLSFISDPNTYVLDSSYLRPPAKINREDSLQPYMRTTDDDFAVIVASDYGQFAEEDYAAGQLQDLFVDAAQTHGIVIDIRRLVSPANPVSDSIARTSFRSAFLKALPVLLHDDVLMASSRRRIHVGYIPQVTANANGYHSAFSYRNAVKMTAAGRDYPDVPIVFVVNAGSEVLFDALAGLQIAHRAKVVYEGYFDQSGGIETYDMNLPDSLTVRLRVTEMIKPDGTVRFDPDLVLPFTTDTTLMASPPIRLALDLLSGKQVAPPVIGRQASSIVPNMTEAAYDDLIFPDTEYRLLALFRLWNAIEYFSPYVYDTGSGWDSALLEFIPRMEEASDSLEYVLALAELGARLNDSRFSIETPILRQYFGVFYAPINVRYVAGKTVVSDVHEGVNTAPDIRPGDAILAIDGENIDSRRERLFRLLSASTPEAVNHKVDSVLLGGRKGTAVHLTIQHGDGEEKEIVLIRTVQYQRPQRRGDIYTVLPNGTGYIDLARLAPNGIDSAMDAVRNTSGLILDLRGRIDFPPESLAGYFAAAKVPVFDISTPERCTPDPHCRGNRDRIITLEPGVHWIYSGRVVVLINENTGSRAERLCLMLSGACKVIFIGNSTGESAGEVTSTILPGGIEVMFIGSGIRYPDGQSIHKTGIQPDVYVEPTIDALRNGRDEILEAAIEYFSQNK